MPYATVKLNTATLSILATLADGSYVSISMLPDGKIRVNGNADLAHFDDLETRFILAYSKNRSKSQAEILEAVRESWEAAELRR